MIFGISKYFVFFSGNAFLELLILYSSTNLFLLLKELYLEGIKQIIVTSSSKNAVKSLLKHSFGELEDIFYSAITMFGVVTVIFFLFNVNSL